MKHSIKKSPHPRSPLKKGWLFTISHVLFVYVLAHAHLTFVPPEKLIPIDEHVGILKWMQAKGGDREALAAHTFYAIVLAPLSLVGWHWFGVDAKPRRPHPKVWHALIPVLYLLPILGFFIYAKPPREVPPGYKSPILNLIASTELSTSITITMAIWLLMGLAYFSFLPLFELSNSDQVTKELE